MSSAIIRPLYELSHYQATTKAQPSSGHYTSSVIIRPIHQFSHHQADTICSVIIRPIHKLSHQQANKQIELLCSGLTMARCWSRNSSPKLLQVACCEWLMVEYKHMFVTDRPKRMCYIKFKVLHLLWPVCDAGLSAPSIDIYHTALNHNPQCGTVYSHRNINAIFYN
jgi:hypothetical protein